ncbi:MAG TPA: carboxymuconolactone decarboxylase family protein [Candidatus Saccharimonadaceae bacterium]|nr:carboxymuconolactone decarboxylase family protein [Candidatus Saccharimonadaceae bacterium]
MDPRLNYQTVAPGVMEAMLGLEKYIGTSGLEESLLNLVRMRSSQINGCVWCLDMHTKDAQAAGEDVQRLLLLPAWREAPLYSDRERAALEWTERVTLLGDDTKKIDDATYDSVRKEFSEKELVDLTLAIIAINGWNRLNVPFHNVACTYVPKANIKG